MLKEFQFPSRIWNKKSTIFASSTTLRGVYTSDKRPQRSKQWNSTLKKCKQLFEYQHLLLLRDIWRSKFLSINKIITHADWLNDLNEEHLEIQHARTFCLHVHETLSLSLTGEQGEHTLLTHQRERERERERKRVRKRERGIKIERDKDREG